MPRGLMMQWFALAEHIRQRNEVMNRRCVEVQRMLEKEGMKSSILKGQGIAELYKEKSGERREKSEHESDAPVGY